MPDGLSVLPDGPGLRSSFLPCQAGPAYAAGLRQVQRTCTLREILFAVANSNFPSFGTGKLLKVILNLNELSE